ncbi:putative transposase [Wolbachia endosymbiont of Cimex lectularius]|nr:putative transposase [Wolbachia endosymbiont of Cimex lectularius]
MLTLPHISKILNRFLKKISWRGPYQQWSEREN